MNRDGFNAKAGECLFKDRGDLCLGFLVEGTVFDIGIEQHPVEVVFDLVDRNGEVDIFSGREYWRQFSVLLDEREGV